MAREGTRLRVALMLVRVASLIVPADLRDEWRREWRGELWARCEEGNPVNGPALGAFVHGFCLRWVSLRTGLEGWIRDLMCSGRVLKRRPLFTLTASLTLALGIGCTTAVYTIVDRVLMAPLPYPGGDRLVRVSATFTPMNIHVVDLTPTIMIEWKARVRALESVEAYAVRDANMVGGGLPAVVHQARVTAGFLNELLAVAPILGRRFEASENLEGRNAIALVSEGMWRTRFGRDPDVVGTIVRIDDKPVEIVGVLPTVAILPAVDIWTPHPMDVDYGFQEFGDLKVLARMAPGVTLEVALDDTERAAVEAGLAYPDLLAAWTPEVTDYRSGLVGDVRSHLLLLLGAVAAVLLIACVNVANLLLARGVEQSNEMAIRRSLGATRGRLVSQVLSEGLILALIGGGIGVLVATLSVDALVSLVPAEIPLATAVSLDVRVLAFAAVMTVGVGLLVGLVPTFRVGRRTVTLGSQRASASPKRRRAGNILLGLEVAQTCALLVAAGLMVNTLYRMNTADSGFDPDGLIFVHLNLPDYAYDTETDPQRRARFLEELRRRVETLPSVSTVGVGTATPFSGMRFMVGLEQDGGARSGADDGGLPVYTFGSRELIYFSRTHVSLSFLETLGLPMVEGRAFGSQDLAGSDPVALINETAANAYWPGETVLGKRVRQGSESPWITIVGVTKDFAHPGLLAAGPEMGMPGHHALAALYLPLTEASPVGLRRPTLLVRTNGDAKQMVEVVRRAVWQIDPDMPIPAVATAIEEIGAGLAVPRFYTELLGFFAVLAVLLASVGIYGVSAQVVGQRTRELGIRLALGASPHQVGGIIFRDGMRIVAIGLVVGLAGAAYGSRLVEDLVYGITPTDPWTYLAVALLLASMAALSMWMPARRAMRADPVTALKAE